MTRRRILLATSAALLAAGTVGAASATAEPTQGVRVANDDYIACAGVETVNVATCVESPTGIVLDLLRGDG